MKKFSFFLLPFFYLCLDSKTFPLREDPSNRSLCPVTHFLALALADGAIEGFDNAAQLKQFRVKEHRNTEELKYKPEWRDTPIIRKTGISKDTLFSRSQAMTANRIGDLLRELGARAGYKEPLTPYCFRRGAYNALEGKTLS